MSADTDTECRSRMTSISRALLVVPLVVLFGWKARISFTQKQSLFMLLLTAAVHLHALITCIFIPPHGKQQPADCYECGVIYAWYLTALVGARD